jgi:hypothetical protein
MMFSECYTFRPRQLRWGLLKKHLMENEYGLECPISWEDVPADKNWIATDKSGETFAFAQRPRFSGGTTWFPSENDAWFCEKVSPPEDPCLCLWQRPK